MVYQYIVIKADIYHNQQLIEEENEDMVAEENEHMTVQKEKLRQAPVRLSFLLWKLQ